MKWWTQALIGTVVLIAIAVGILTLISMKVSSASRADTLATLVGGTTGVLVVVVWAFFFARHNLQKEREKEKDD